MSELISLKTLTADTFEPYVNTTFQLKRTDDSDSPVTLTQLSRYSVVSNSGRQQFSLVFVGTPGEVLPQHIYPLHHPDLGALELFLVPIGVCPEGTRYEAVFT